MADEHSGSKILYIIYNTIRPYGYEINNVLCLPIGFSYWCRYRKEYLPTFFGKNAKDDVEQIIGMEGLIVLRDYNNPNHFYPIRWVKIINYVIWGEIVRIDFEVRETVDLHEDKAKRIDQFHTFGDILAAKGHFRTSINNGSDRIYINDPQSDLENLIFIGDTCRNELSSTYAFVEADAETKDLETQQRTEIQRWMRVIELLAETLEKDMTKFYWDFDFYKITKVMDSAENTIFNRTAHAKSFLGWLPLSNNRVYKLEVIHRTFTHRQGDSALPLPVRVLEIESDPSEIDVVVGRQALLSKYDIIEFSFRTRSKIVPCSTFVNLNYNRRTHPDIAAIEQSKNVADDTGTTGSNKAEYYYSIATAELDKLFNYRSLGISIKVTNSRIVIVKFFWSILALIIGFTFLAWPSFPFNFLHVQPPSKSVLDLLSHAGVAFMIVFGSSLGKNTYDVLKHIFGDLKLPIGTGD